MSNKPEKFLYNIDDLSSGIFRELTKGITTRVYPGDEAMISVVRVEPNAEGTVHSHPQEQWGLLIRGSATRLQGENTFKVREGDFWRTPGNVCHGVIGGPDGAVILDVFAPPRAEYLETGTGFGESK